MTLAERIAKLQEKATAARAAMTAALDASQADGLTADQKAAHLAAFDAAEKLKDEAEADLHRAMRLDKAEADSRQPDRAPIIRQPNNPSAGGGPCQPAPRLAFKSQRRTGGLKAFKGKDEDGVSAEERAYQAGLWMAATIYGNASARQMYEDRYGNISATLSTSNNSGAAFFVPDRIDLDIVKLTEQYGVIRRDARIKPMDSDTLSTPRWTGTLNAYFVGEGAAPTQSEQTYDMVLLVAKNLAAYGKISRQLSEDSLINLGDEWTEFAAIAFANKEDDSAFNGDGTSTYGGITGIIPKLQQSGNSASLYTAAAGHVTAAGLTLADFEGCAGLYPNYPGANPKWYVHKTVYWNAMVPLLINASRVTPADIENGPNQLKFLSYDVVFTNVLPKASTFAANTLGIVFGDLKLGVHFGDRRQRTFETGLINDDLIKQLMTLFTSERFDVNVHTLVDPKNTANPGPVLGLVLPAS